MSNHKQMTVITKEKRQKFTEEQKKELIEQFESSGMSLNAFAKQNGIAPPNFSQWRKKLRVLPVTSLCLSTHPQHKLRELEDENERLTGELATIRKAFGEKLISLEMLKH